MRLIIINIYFTNTYSIELDGKNSSRLNMGGMHGNKWDGTLAGLTLCLIIGGGSCKWQLTALVKAVAGDCCSV